MFLFNRKPNLKLLAVLSFLALIALGVFVYIFFNKQERPPELPSDMSFFQGYIGIENDRFFEFEESDLVANSEFLSALKVDGHMIQGFHTDRRVSFAEIIDSIKPMLDNKFVLAVYRPSENKFYTYPRGPYNSTVTVKDSELDSFMVPAGGGFFIAANNDFWTKNIKHGSQSPNYVHYSIADLEKGWNLLSVSDSAEFKNMINRCQNRVKSVWVQKSDTEFVRTENLYFPELKPGFHLVWWLIGDEQNDCQYYNPQGGGDEDLRESADVCVNDLPVCDVNGRFYMNYCELTALGATPSDQYVVDVDSCVLIDDYVGSPMPNLCNPLLLDPVCDINGTDWYRNNCEAEYRGATLSDTLTYVNGACVADSEYIPTPMPSLCNALLDAPVCNDAQEWYRNICMMEHYTGSDVVSTIYHPGDVDECLTNTSQELMIPESPILDPNAMNGPTNVGELGPMDDVMGNVPSGDTTDPSDVLPRDPLDVNILDGTTNSNSNIRDYVPQNNLGDTQQDPIVLNKGTKTPILDRTIKDITTGNPVQNLDIVSKYVCEYTQCLENNGGEILQSTLETCQMPTICINQIIYRKSNFAVSNFTLDLLDSLIQKDDFLPAYPGLVYCCNPLN